MSDDFVSLVDWLASNIIFLSLAPQAVQTQDEFKLYDNGTKPE